MLWILYYPVRNNPIRCLCSLQNTVSLPTRINTELHRELPFWMEKVWYSKEEIKVVMVLIRKNEFLDLLRIVKQEDPKAFDFDGKCNGVYGQGFERIKL